MLERENRKNQNVILSQGELQFIMSKKIGRTAWSVYCCLSAHCNSSEWWCNVTIPSITSWLADNVNQKTIGKALKELDNKGLIERGDPKARDRFKLCYKRKQTVDSVISKNLLDVAEDVLITQDNITISIKLQ